VAAHRRITGRRDVRVDVLVVIGAIVVGVGVGAMHQVANRVGTWAAGTVAYMTTVAVLAGLTLYLLGTSDGVPLVACAVVIAALYPWRRTSPPR
jgi:hypothetical protein